MDYDKQFKECCDLITYKLPNVEHDFTNLPKIKVVLKNLIDERVIYLTNNYSNDEDVLRNDLELVDLEEFYAMIGRKIYYQSKQRS